MDSDSNNLCIPEDAFEQFQAVSMYQEEEYITLSEIVPAKPVEPDPEFSHVSYDNEVIVTTENEVNSTVNDNTEVVESVEQQNLEDSCKETNERSDEGLAIILAQDNKPKLQKVSRRGRKKKHVIEHDRNTVINNSAVLSSVQDSSDNQINTDHESPVISSTSPPRKRGRKPKPKPVPSEPVASLGISQDFSNISKTPFSSDPENSDNNIVKKKRGRPKKILVPNDQTNSKAISDMDTSELSSSDNYRNDDLLSPSKLEIRTKGKRGRPRKVSLETNIDHQIKQNLEVNEFQIEDLNGTQSTNCNIRKSVEIDLAKTEQEHLDEKHTLNSNSKPKSDEDSKILSLFSEDDLDDISLSKLKDQPDTTKSANGVSEKSEGENSANNSFENTCSDPLSSPVKKGRGSAKKGQSGRPKKISAKVLDKSEPIVDSTSNNDTRIVDPEDETDDLSLSTLKEMNSVTVNTENDDTTEVSTSVVVDFEVDTIGCSPNNINETPSKRNTKVPVMSDFEYNIDSVVDKETTVKDEIANNDLLMEDTSKRPIRRKVPKLKYDEESDEDPFANVELSDDDEPRRRRGNKYYSDDEYIPGRRGNKDIDSTDSEAEVLLDEAKKQRRRKFRTSEKKSPCKKEKGGEGDLSHNALSDDVEICLEPTVIKASDDSQSQAWGSSSEFENFLAKKIQGTNLKIKKLSATDPSENKTLKIPVIDPEARKTLEMCTQTNVINTVSMGVQTNVPYDIPMKENITLTPEQSEKACYFLNSIVKTTSELGTLMTQKSEDFIKKKINTVHVTDTMKMDYCVKKSFLLFKLAKHNLMQMEEDLAKQYDEFLKSNNLMACREIQKEVVASAKPASSDSDCEIVEVISQPVKPTTVKKHQVKPKFNPKTVFLNKELSIKIAKKPTENKKLDIKGRHTVWINDTVMVKKVKPTQSFLAQDSRNKKPPDNIITTKMVSDFFKNYYRQKAISLCAPFVSTDWLNVGRDCVCNYFVVQPASQCNNNLTYSGNRGISTTMNANVSETNLAVKNILNKTIVTCPETLLKMCFRIIKNRMNDVCQIKEVCQHAQNELTDGKNKPVSLVQLCLRAMTGKADRILESSPTPLKKKPADNTTLLQLCLKAMTSNTSLESSPTPLNNKHPDDTSLIVIPLKTLCHQRIVALLYNSCQNYSSERQSFSEMRFSMEETIDTFASCSLKCVYPSSKKIYKVKTLLCLCVELIQQKQALEISNNSILMPKLLKCIAFQHVKQLLYGDLQVACYDTSHLNSNQHNDEITIDGLTINSVNTLSEEAFLNLEQSHPDSPDNPDYLDDFDTEDQYNNEYVEAEEEHETETSWVSQVQMQELRSCVNTNSTADQEEMSPIVTQIKLEPLDNIIENVDTPVHVKAELCPGPDEMTILPHIKAELLVNSGPGPIQRQDSNSYDVDAFEQFVATNKLMNPLNEDDIFSQSALRVRRQHEPDYELDDMSMSLLVPQTYEPLNIETAKGSLMESSSDEGSSKTKKTAKKKPDKRHKCKQKKVDPKTNKETPVLIKEKATNNEVASLTKKMRDRIRQEEKKDDSTDSEGESSIPLRLRNRKEQDKSKPAQKSHADESEIQCSNVDSTDQVDDDIGSFTGFTAIDQNEISTYQKYMKYVYDKIIPDKEEENPNKDLPVSNNHTTNERFEEPLIALNEPVELLECEPTMPIFDDQVSARKSSRRNKGKEILSKTELTAKGASSKEDIPKEGLSLKTEEIIKKVVTSKLGEIPNKGEGSRLEELLKKKRTPLKEEMLLEKSASFIERHGWQCYQVNPGDFKLYQTTKIVLEKLPETFVQTYMEYQGITRKDESDQEIDRLTNLNSLSRGGQLQTWNKTKVKSKRDPKDENTPEAGSRVESPTFSDQYELEPSDDEGAKVEDEVAPPIAQKHTENTLAKNLLMDDNDSDCEGHAKVKQEPLDHVKHNKSSRSKKKEDVKVEDSANLMLTADKMMNKELTLLHAPVVPTADVKNAPSTGPVTRNKQKSASKNQSSTSKLKTEEDSSSEEEKQWVTTKEKLLKRVGKKEHTSLDDAKRAKLVSEFIERRADFPDAHKRGRTKTRRSTKKFLERQKQLRVLSRELFGESSDSYMSKRSQKAQASLLYKGRRNIRKVIDKKSLARSTVVANMEEFERKRKLNSRQTKLRELLGCEEGVNVLVINDEVCLEYNFEENRPVVTVHPFFTKVMKAHQYEGVKFMWDACFESLAEIKAGHPGGGCILAHCMGLGKTLQVLALLHTVLTHPGVKMQRVLVCCPLSTVLNWVDEIHKWIGPVTNQIKVFELSKLKKTYERAYQLEDWYNGGGIFIIGYELFRSLTTLDPFLDDVRPTIINKIRTALLDPGPDIVVCDEGHLLKNDCSVLAVAMSRVVTKRRIILTGTPMQNNLREYYCMVNFVKPNLLGTYAEYSNRFENPIMNGQHRDSREEDIKLMKARTHILHKVLEGCLQRQEASVLYPYLPKKYEYTVFISLTQCQWDLYKHYLNNYGKHNKQSILKDFHILQKIWSHPQVLHNFQTKARDRDEKNKLKEKLEDDLATEDMEDIKPNAVEDLWWLEYLEGGKMLETLDSSNKFIVVFRILDECVALGDKVLIFSTSLFCLDALEYFLKKINKWSLGQEYFRLDGSVPAEVRQNWCREFNSDNNYKTKLFLVSTRAGCLGLNMTAANRVIIMDTSWNPAHDIQSIFRVYRFGQKKDCYIYRLVAMGTMEQKIYERSVTKQAVACRVVDEQQIDRHYNMAELTELYKFDEGAGCVAGGVAAGVRDVALLRVARDAAAALHAVHEHDSLLRGDREQGLPEHERNAAWMQFQQEHTHKQMENKLIVNIPSVSLKRVHGHDYALSSAPPAEIKTEPNASHDPTTEPKPKKGKKSAVLKCNIPIQEEDKHKKIPLRGRQTDATTPIPSTSKDYSNTNVLPNNSSETARVIINQEEVMVERITDILLRYNFHKKKGNTEISKLVARVRNMVKKGYVDNEDMSDKLTASIAKVLLPNQLDLPKVTNIMCESINNSAAPNAVPSGADPELITSDPSPNYTVFTHQKNLKHEPGLRTRRRAALEAVKSMDSIAQDVIINLDDHYDSRDTDFVPVKYGKTQKPNVAIDKGKRKSKNSSPIEPVNSDEGTLSASPPPESFNIDINPAPMTSTKDQLKIHNKPKQTYGPKKRQERLKDANQAESKQEKKTVELEPSTSTAVRDNSKSILLSDDDEPISSFTKPTETPAVEPTEKFPEIQDKDEVVPLPTSLLKNQNFINIVAHTYLVGNPMLDEDAATLAAQYSTLKALKEAERTGQEVCSGPIYDIAVKVIGKEVLKKMQSVNPKAASSSADDAAASIQKKEKMIAAEKSSKEKAKSPHNLRDSMIMEKLGITKATPAEVQPSITVKPTASMTNKVVPVGLIKTTASVSVSQSFGQPLGAERVEPRVECILPDDDDVIISDVRATPAPPLALPAPPGLLAAPAPPVPHAPPAPPTPDAPPPTRTLKPAILCKKQQLYETQSCRVTVGNSAPTPVPQTLSKLARKPPVILNTTLSTAPKTLVVGPIAAERAILNDGTICLDSDEEEPTPTARPWTSSMNSMAPALPNAAQAPVPVSLMMANAPGVNLPLPPMPGMGTVSSPQQLPPQTLVLRQVVTSSGTQAQYVLVPADQVPIPILPKPPIPEKPNTYTSQPQPLSTQTFTPTVQRTQSIPQNPPQPVLNTYQTAFGNSVLSNKSADFVNKLHKASCKPGDILRISKTGVIEVINRNDIKHIPTNTNPAPIEITNVVNVPKSTASTAAPQLISNNSSSEATKSKTVAQKINDTYKTLSQNKVEAPRVRQISSSSSSSDSSPSSPENPLSILQNVVQIQAVNYSSTQTSKNHKPLPEKGNKLNVSVQHIVSSDLKTSTTSASKPQSSGLVKLTKVPKEKLPKYVDTAVEKQIKKEALLKRITPLLTKNQQNPKEEQKARGKNTISFDNLNSATTSKLLKATGKPIDKKGGSSKGPLTVDLTHLISDGTSVMKSKRQSSSSDQTPVKKKRTEPMTLKDFNLDDIDDIIELE